MSRPNHSVIAVHIIMNIQSITLLNQDNWLIRLSVFQHFSELVSAVAHRWRCRSINSPSSNKIRRFKISQHCPNNSNTTQFDRKNAWYLAHQPHLPWLKFLKELENYTVHVGERNVLERRQNLQPLFTFTIIHTFHFNSVSSSPIK